MLDTSTGIMISKFIFICLCITLILIINSQGKKPIYTIMYYLYNTMFWLSGKNTLSFPLSSNTFWTFHFALLHYAQFLNTTECQHFWNLTSLIDLVWSHRCKKSYRVKIIIKSWCVLILKKCLHLTGSSKRSRMFLMNDSIYWITG